jgi:hypothetical protein
VHVGSVFDEVSLKDFEGIAREYVQKVCQDIEVRGSFENL